MGHLDKLTITSRVFKTPRRRKKVNTVEYRRNKLVANIEEQIELVHLALRGEDLQLKRKRGHRIVPVRPRLWWKVLKNGEVIAEVRYNKKVLSLASQGTTIELDRLEALPQAYQIVVTAVEAGELDQAIAAATGSNTPKLLQ